MKFRFALVDDATFIREILKNIGESLGGECVGEAENGREAIKLVKSTLPDLLFLDLVMPQKNGLEIIDELKEIWPDIKIVACSTLDQEEVLEQLKAKGVIHYLNKPFSKAEVETVIQKLMFSRKENVRV